MIIPHIAIYIRVSTVDQAVDGISIEQQEATVLAKIREHYGDAFTYELFADPGMSGGRGPKPWQTERRPRDRKQLWQMLVGLKDGKFSHVAAYRLDRIYRDYASFITLYNEVMKPKGIDFILVADNFDKSLAGQMAQGVLAQVAEYQRLQNSDNIRRVLDYRRTQGYYQGTIPFGWRKEEPEEHVGRRPNITPVPEEGEVVKRIAQMYLSGLSEQGIADQLNAESVPHKKSVGKWRGNTVNLVLVNPTHAGLVRTPDGSLIQGIHFEHRYYDESLLAQIQARLERNRKRLKGVAHTQPFRLFSGIATCGHCGKKLQGSFHTEHPGYRCLGRMDSSDGAHVYISAKSLEALVVSELANLARDPQVFDSIESEIDSLVRRQGESTMKRAAEIRKSLSEWNEREDVILDSLAKKVLSQSQARRKLEEIQATKLKFEAELADIDRALERTGTQEHLIRQAKATLPRFDQIWDRLTDAERREALHITIEELKVFAKEDRKWLELKLVFRDSPIEIEVLRGAERYRSGKLDGAACLTPRELAALKHAGDGANYVLIAKYFESTPTNAHALLRRAMQKLNARSVADAVALAAPTIRRLTSQLPLYGKIEAPKHSPKRLKVMEYQILSLAAEGKGTKEIALQTGVSVERVKAMLDSALTKLDVKGAVAGMNKLSKDDSLIPVTMSNRRRRG